MYFKENLGKFCVFVMYCAHIVGSVEFEMIIEVTCTFICHLDKNGCKLKNGRVDMKLRCLYIFGIVLVNKLNFRCSALGGNGEAESWEAAPCLQEQ